MPPDSPYDTHLGRESGKLTSAPPKNFVAHTPMLATIADKLNSLLKKVEKLLDEIKSHDQSLFESNGLTLKKKWQRFHHTCDESFITSLSQIELEINTVLTKVEVASTRFNVVCKQRKVSKNSAAINKRKNDKKK